MDENEGDFKIRRRNFLKEQRERVHKNYTSNWQRKLVMLFVTVEAKVKHRKLPFIDDSQPGVIYVNDRRFGGDSFWYFKPEHPLRRGAIKIITDPWYMKFSGVLLVLHVIPTIIAEPGVPRHRFSDAIPELTAWIFLLADRFLILYFTIELGITFIAYGFLRTCTNAFRLIDLVSIIIAFAVDAIPHDLNGGGVARYFIALNSLRVFRIVGRVEGMRKLMMVLVSCVPTLLNVGILLGTLIYTLSVVGLIFFRDAPHNRCVSESNPADITYLCTPPGYSAFENGGQICDTGYNCSMYQPTTSDWGNFDNMAESFFSIVQIFTLDDWYVLASEIMNGYTPYVYFFFALGAIFGAFWAMNLILAVVTDAFSRFHQNEKELKSRKKRMEQALFEKHLDDDDGDGDDAAAGGGGGADDQELEELLSDGGGGGDGKEDPLLPQTGGKKRGGKNRRLRGVSVASRASSGGGSEIGSDDSAADNDADSSYYSPLPGDENEEYRLLTGGMTKGTHPWFKRKLQMWLRNLSNASTNSLLAGIQTLDVRSMIEAEAGTVRMFHHEHNMRRNARRHHDGDGDGEHHHHHHDHDHGGEQQMDSTGLFDDSDLVELAAHANLSGAAQAARFRGDDGSRKSAIAQRVQTIESWTRSMPAADQLSVIPDHEPEWEITEDEMFDPTLHVPSASDTVGTRGKHFYPMSMFKPLTLFERYQLAAERANRGEVPEDQESEDDVDLGFVDQNEMSFAKIKHRLARQKKRAARAAAMKGAAHSKQQQQQQQRQSESAYTLDAFKMQLQDWCEALGASYRSMPFIALLKMVHASLFFQRLLTTTVILNALLLSCNYYGAPDGLITTITVFTAFNDIVLVADMVAILYYKGWFSRGQKREEVTAATAIDILVGVLSLVDLVVVVPGFARVLRGIRGIRLIKLAKNFTLLHEMINKMRSAFYYFICLLAVCLFFVIAFSTIGRHVFDGWMPPVQNCYKERYDFTCNNQPDCIFVTRAEWVDPAFFLQYPTYRERVFLPLDLSNMTVDMLEVFRLNETLVNETPAVSQYFAEIEPYRCRQFKNWLGAVPTDRLTFNSPTDAFLTIFNAITKDNFSAVMYRFMSISPWTSIMFLFMLIIGSYLLVSLLVSILLVHFSELQVIADKNEADEEDGSGLETGKVLRDKEKEEEEEDPETWASRPALGGVTHPPSNIASQPVHREAVPEDATWPTRLRAKLGYWFRKLLRLFADVADPLIHPENLMGDSLFVFSPTSTIRLRCCDIISGKVGVPFEQTVVLSSLAHLVLTFIIADQDYRDLNDSSPTMAAAITGDWVLVAISLADLAARVIAQGALFGPYTFWHSRFENRVDAVTIFCSTLASFYRLGAGRSLTGVSVDMFFRSVRPMRIIIRSRGMKNVALAVYKTLPAMGRVVGLAAALIWMLALVCVEYFGGVLRTCSDGSDRAAAECFGTFQQRGLRIVDGKQITVLLNETRTFRNLNEYNFDNIFFAFNSLTALAVASQWTNVVFSLIDSPEIAGGSPIRNNRQWMAILVVVWIVLGNFVLLNIFVGTIVDNFSKFKLKLAGALFKTPEEVELAQIQLMLKTTRVKKALSVPEEPFLHHKLNQFCFTVVTSTPFLYWTRFVTVFDMFAIATVHYDMSSGWMTFQEAATRAVSIALWLEVFLKIGISGPKPYVSIWFNRIDLIMACVVGAESLLYVFRDHYRVDPFLHAVRVVSCFRLVREVKSFRSLLKSGLRALPALSNIGALVLLVLFFTSLLAMGFFQNVRVVIQSPSGVNLDHSTNFRTIPRAMIAMFLTATLDNWGDVMQACSAERPNCVEGVDCGEPVLANIFFIIYIILVGFVMINLFITVVLENFSESVLVPQYITERLKDVNMFRQLWVTFDPSGRQVIGAKQFVELLQRLPGPRFRLGRLRGDIEAGDNVSECSWASEEKEKYAAHSAIGLMGEPVAAVLPTLRELGVPMVMPHQEILFADALDIIGDRIFHISLLDQSATKLKSEIRKTAKEYEGGYEIAHYYAAARIQQFTREVFARAGKPRDLYGNTILWDQILKPLFVQRWKNNAESIFKPESIEEASLYRKFTQAMGSRGAEGDAGGDGDDGSIRGGGGKRRRRGGGGSSKGRGTSSRSGSPRSRRGGDGGNAFDDDDDDDDGMSSPRSARSGGFGSASGGSPTSKKKVVEHIKPLLYMKSALGDKMMEVEEEPDEDLSWLTAIEDVESTGSSWADDEGEEAWLPASAISGERTIRNVGVAPECRRHGGVFELVSVDELISRRKREQVFLSHFAPVARQRLENLPLRTRKRFRPTPIPTDTSKLGELIEQHGMKDRGDRGGGGGRSGGGSRAFGLYSGGGGGGNEPAAAASPSSALDQQQQQNGEDADDDLDLLISSSSAAAAVARDRSDDAALGLTKSSLSRAVAAGGGGGGRVFLADIETPKKAAPRAHRYGAVTTSLVDQLLGQQQQTHSSSGSSSPTTTTTSPSGAAQHGKLGAATTKLWQQPHTTSSGATARKTSDTSSNRPTSSLSIAAAAADDDDAHGADADIDDALIELSRRVEADRLRTASRLSGVAQARARATNNDQQQRKNSQPYQHRTSNAVASGGAVDDDDKDHDPTSSSVARVRKAVFDSAHLRGVSLQRTADLVAATAEAAAAVPFGPQHTEIEVDEEEEEEAGGSPNDDQNTKAGVMDASLLPVASDAAAAAAVVDVPDSPSPASAAGRNKRRRSATSIFKDRADSPAKNTGESTNQTDHKSGK